MVSFNLEVLVLQRGTVFDARQLLDILYREETLLNVVRSVTKNGRSILLTAVLGVILIYLFSIIGFIFFQDDFMMEINPLSGKTGMTAIVFKYIICTVILLTSGVG